MNIRDLNELRVCLDQAVEVYFDGLDKYSGKVLEFLEGRRASQFDVVDGVKHGVETTYSTNERISCIANFRNGLLEGEVKHFFENGRLKEEAFFEKGVCIRSTSFDDDGAVLEHFVIDEGSPEYIWLKYLRKSDET